MKSRRFTLGLVGLAVAAVLTGILLVSAFGSASDGQAATVPDRASGVTAPDRPTIACFGSADAAEQWLRAGLRPACVRERTPDRSARPHCVTTADATEHWIRATGHRPCAR